MVSKSMEFFPPRPDSKPTIYAYELPTIHQGFIKVGYTTQNVTSRIRDQLHVAGLTGKYRLLGTWPAMRSDGNTFSDKAVHNVLKSWGVRQLNEDDDRNEWFKCNINKVKAAVIAVTTGTENVQKRTMNFKMRYEQQQAVDKAIAYFTSESARQEGHPLKFLWNAKMRFGKTFAAYQLAKKMGLKRVLILTFKPAVQTAWRDDLLTHIDFEGWQFISRSMPNGQTEDEQYASADKNKPIVCFGSFQDFLGENENGGFKAKNEWLHDTEWDLVIFDEYHFGAWRDTVKKLFEQDEDSYDEDFGNNNLGDTPDETWLPIAPPKYYLFLSGTPFRALSSGEFIESQVYNWTYADEQQAKEKWEGSPEKNPYAALPRMVMLTYNMPNEIKEIASQGEFNEFDLNAFFAAEGERENAHFLHENEVQKWLDMIRGAYSPIIEEGLRQRKPPPPMPYSDTTLLNVLSHTLWFLPDVASCYAMDNLLKQRQNRFYHDYKVKVCAGSQAGMGAAALEPVRKAMEPPLETRSITLSCGKLTTGVTIKPWAGILMLRNMSSPETYFQAAFRVQSPWETTTDDGKREIIKKECYVFDFALNRALRLIFDYSCRLNPGEGNPEEKVKEFINFLPVLAYDNGYMTQIDAKGIIEEAMTGTTSTLLAKRWESALLVNVNNDTLARLLQNQKAMDALMRIEEFRGLNADIVTIINKSEKIKNLKQRTRRLTPRQKEQLSEEEKTYRDARKRIQEKLIKFATRIPIFMYLSDCRELSLHDVVTAVEPELFKKVTGLEVDEFQLLLSLNVFDSSRMNDAVYKFKVYEDRSLEYTGINKHEGEEEVGLFDVTIPRSSYDSMNR